MAVTEKRGLDSRLRCCSQKEETMSPNKTRTCLGLLAFALQTATCSFQPTFSFADGPQGATDQDQLPLWHLQPGTEITLPINANLPSDTNYPLGDGSSCILVPSESKQNRAINGTFALTVASVSCGSLGFDCTEYHGINVFLQGRSTFNGVPQKGDLYITCGSGDMKIADFRSLIEQGGGSVKVPDLVNAQQL